MDDYLNQIFGEMMSGKKQSPEIITSLLADRFQPTIGDTSRSITQTAQSYAEPNLFKPTTPQQEAATRMSSELAPYSFATKLTGETPSAIREWSVFSNLPPEDQRRYLQMKRADQVMNLGGTMAVRSPTGGIGEQYQVTPKPEQMPEFRGAQATAEAAGKAGVEIKTAPQIAGSVEAAKETAKNVAQAQTSLPQVIDQTKNAVGLLDEIKKHPAKSISIGAYGLVPAIPGTEQADFVSRLDQIQGQNFLQAYNTLKGGGQITEVEGRKATDAMSRLSRKLGQKDFDKAIDDLKSVLDAGMKRAAQKASIGQPAGIMLPGNAPPIQPQGGFDIDSYLNEKGLR